MPKQGPSRNNVPVTSRPFALTKVMETVRRDPVLRPIGLNYLANVRKLSTRRVAAVAHVNTSESVARIEQTNVREAASVGGLSIFLCDVVMSAIGTKQTWAVALHMSAFGGKAGIVRRVLGLLGWRRKWKQIA